MNKLLEGIKVLDFSARLPGPMAGHCLALMGAQVTKIENSDWGEDPFYEGDENFQAWYHGLNQHKKIEKLSFTDQQHELVKSLQQAEIVLAPFSKKIKALIEGNFTGGVVYVASSKTRGGMHDLNALALTKSFQQHFLDSSNPPYLPFAGISFGQMLAQAALGTLVQSQRTKCLVSEVLYLDECAIAVLDALNPPQQKRYLHNGSFPCYQVYETKDGGHIGLAAVEEHYWTEFCQCFGLELSLEQRFDETGEVEKILRKLFTNLESGEIKEKIYNRRFCLTVMD